MFKIPFLYLLMVKGKCLQNMKDKRDWGFHLPMHQHERNEGELGKLWKNSGKICLNLKDFEHDIEVTFICTRLRYIWEDSFTLKQMNMLFLWVNHSPLKICHSIWLNWAKYFADKFDIWSVGSFLQFCHWTGEAAAFLFSQVFPTICICCPFKVFWTICICCPFKVLNY